MQLSLITISKIQNFLFHKSKTGCPENWFPDPVGQLLTSQFVGIFVELPKIFEPNWIKFTSRCSRKT